MENCKPKLEKLLLSNAFYSIGFVCNMMSYDIPISTKHSIWSVKKVEVRTEPGSGPQRSTLYSYFLYRQGGLMAEVKGNLDDVKKRMIELERAHEAR